MYYTSQLISWTLGQLAPWRKIRETCETDIHTRRIYIYVCIYLYIWNNIYIICIHCIYIDMDDLITIVMGYLWNINETLIGIQLRMGFLDEDVMDYFA